MIASSPFAPRHVRMRERRHRQVATDTPFGSLRSPTGVSKLPLLVHATTILTQGENGFERKAVKITGNGLGLKAVKVTGSGFGRKSVKFLMGESSRHRPGYQPDDE